MNVHFDSEKILKRIMIVLPFLIFQMSFLLSDFYLAVTPDRLVYNQVFSFQEQVYTYADKTAIRTAPVFTAQAGNTVARREYMVAIKDGRKWSSIFLPGIARNPAQKDAFFIELSRRSRVTFSNQTALSRKDTY